jgi:hypothetical protein
VCHGTLKFTFLHASAELLPSGNISIRLGQNFISCAAGMSRSDIRPAFFRLAGIAIILAKDGLTLITTWRNLRPPFARLIPSIHLLSTEW